jgi:hypothetical protein
LNLHLRGRNSPATRRSENTHAHCGWNERLLTFAHPAPLHDTAAVKSCFQRCSDFMVNLQITRTGILKAMPTDGASFMLVL